MFAVAPSWRGTNTLTMARLGQVGGTATGTTPSYSLPVGTPGSGSQLLLVSSAVWVGGSIGSNSAWTGDVRLNLDGTDLTQYHFFRNGNGDAVSSNAAWLVDVAPGQTGSLSVTMDQSPWSMRIECFSLDRRAKIQNVYQSTAGSGTKSVTCNVSGQGYIAATVANVVNHGVFNNEYGRCYHYMDEYPSGVSGQVIEASGELTVTGATEVGTRVIYGANPGASAYPNAMSVMAVAISAE